MEPAATITISAARQAGPFLIREIAYPPGFRQPRHSHPSDGVTLLLSGVIRESVRWGEEVGTALSVVAIELGGSGLVAEFVFPRRGGPARAVRLADDEFTRVVP